MTDQQIEEIYKYWMNASVEAFDTAKVIFEGGRYVHALFFCHLAIEKMLKAFVVKRTKDHAPYDHNLIKLAENAGVKFSDQDMDTIAEINTFNIEGRYDDYKLKFYKKATKLYAEKYFDEVKRIMLWLKEQ